QDRGDGVRAELHVDLPAHQVVHDRDVVALLREVQGRGPTAETISTGDDDLHVLFLHVLLVPTGGGPGFRLCGAGSTHNVVQAGALLDIVDHQPEPRRNGP